MFTEGCTALGPALAISAGMIAGTPLSEVVLCTDGEPNVGVGNLDYPEGAAFYKKVNFICIFVFYRSMDAKIGALHTAGSTALGPALAISAGIISNIPMSEVILCTDGEPNQGIGSLNGSRRQAGAEFYKTVHIDVYNICH